MDTQVLSRNIRRLRQAGGRRLSLRALAKATGLSEPALKKLEAGQTMPRTRTLQAIASALGVRLHDLMTAPRTLNSVRFRSKKMMKSRGVILDRVSRWLDSLLYLEQVTGNALPFALASVLDACRSNGPVAAAQLCRRALNLDQHEPIYDIIGLLVKAGVRVWTVQVSEDGFFGLAVGLEDGGPAIVVNCSEKITVERQIFSAAHELGHIMLHPDAFDSSSEEERSGEEDEANQFASHFLMPAEGFERKWKESRGLHWLDQILEVKTHFRVSYKTVLMRLIELDLVDRGTIWPSFKAEYQRRYDRRLGNLDEPTQEGAEPHELPEFAFREARFLRLIREALEGGFISVGRAAAMLETTPSGMPELIESWEPAR